MVAQINAWVARTGWFTMVANTWAACSAPVVVLTRRWVTRAMRTGELTRATGASDGALRAARSTQAQNKVSSKSDKDIVEGGEKIG
jgi:hypothetical protein